MPSPIVARLAADPPVVHGIWDETGTRVDTGLWSTDVDCYELIAERCDNTSRTLETGLGLSTALLAALGARHTCVTYSQEEVDRLKAYCAAHDISTSTLTFAIGLSDAVLPTLDPTPLDLVLIDGGHGFPTPVIDWFYGAARLVKGGVVVIDDLQLPAPLMLADYLRQDNRWRECGGSGKWTAFERRSEGSLSEDWWAQKFFRFEPPTSLTAKLRSVVGNQTKGRWLRARAARSGR